MEKVGLDANRLVRRNFILIVVYAGTQGQAEDKRE
jgi:hypothetical protein